jgi:hypothetical protein
MARGPSGGARVGWAYRLRHPIRGANNLLFGARTALRRRRFRRWAWFIGDDEVPFDELPGRIPARATITRRGDLPWGERLRLWRRK